MDCGVNQSGGQIVARARLYPSWNESFKYEVFVAGVQHLDHHVADVAGGEELSSVPAKVRTYDLFIRLTLDVHIGVKQREHLKLRDNVCQNLRVEFDLLDWFENLRVLSLDVLE